MGAPEPNNVDAQLIALREKVEDWLIEYGEYRDESEEIAANNITLWATLFLRVTEAEAQDAADRLRHDGAEDFVERVRRSAQAVYGMVGGAIDANEVTASAYAVEVMRLEGI